MLSMTAFGRSQQIVGGKEITVEIRSVNSRYLDCSVRISRVFSQLEEKIKPYLTSRGITRGKVDINISVETLTSAADSLSVDLDEGYAAAYIDALKRLRDRFDLKDDITVMSVAQNHDIFSVRHEADDADRDWELLKPVLDAALDLFLAGRVSEGKRLETDLVKKLDLIKSHLAEIEKISLGNIAGYREKLAERVKTMLSDNSITVDENRLLTECALFADKIAIDEEIVRLRSHFEAFDQIRGDTAPAGRKLDFLLQEMNRETNTIGSKSIDADIAHHVVDIKNELEKIREQVQNIE